jgi:hypothetical protein
MTKPDDDDDRMQKNGENVAHSQDGIRVKKTREFTTLALFATHGIASARLRDIIAEGKACVSP